MVSFYCKEDATHLVNSTGPQEHHVSDDVKMSLAETIDTVNDAVFFNRVLAKPERLRLARAIAERQGQPHAYAGTFALADAERNRGITLFTGDRATGASARHIAGEEAGRALHLLDVADKRVNAALVRATQNMIECLDRAEHSPDEKAFGQNPGLFCCARCTVSMWRHLTAGGLDRTEERLQQGVRVLPKFHLPGGRFARFPFWYTVSALVEMDLTESRMELKRLVPLLNRAAKRTAGSEPYASRRRELARRALKHMS